MAPRIECCFIGRDKQETWKKLKVKDGQVVYNGGSYKVHPDATTRNRGKTRIYYNEGNTDPINPFGRPVVTTAEQANEDAHNGYVRQIMHVLQGGFEKATPWITIGIIVLGFFILGYIENGTSNGVHDLQTHLNYAHPPPTPTPSQQPPGGT